MDYRKLIPLLILPMVLCVIGCGGRQEKPQESIPASTWLEPAKREIFHVFSFDGIRGNRYLVHFDGPGLGATIFTHDEVRPLALVPSASGSKYADDRLMIWIKGEELIMEVDGKRVGPCKVSGLQSVLAQAWLGGTDFWAVGNEPSWNLVMGRERVVLLTDLGQTKQEFPGLKPGQLDSKSPVGTYVFGEGSNTLKVEIIDGLCTDIMSGEPFAVSVRITLNQKEITGCGTGLY